MKKFTHYIQTKRGLVSFTFQKVYTVDGLKYMIAAADNKMHLRPFYMNKGKDKWNIVEREKMPEWVLLVEEQLNNSITKNYA